jgi:3-oxoacyl-[acyl-carrier protein] reductase
MALGVTADRRTAFVTGGSRGIGAGVVRALAARGLNVACGYRHSYERAQELAREIGETVVPLPYELGCERSAEAAVDTLARTWGRLDSLVLNAATWQGGRLDQMTADTWWSVVQANVAGMAQTSRAALKLLRAAEAPSIVLVSSVVGMIGYPGDTAYASSKAAMIGFARSLSKELGRDGIRVNVVAPGFVDTDMTAQVSSASRAQIQDQTVLRRLGTTDEIARAVAFLSEDATYCTGTVLTVDGGWSI